MDSYEESSRGASGKRISYRERRSVLDSFRFNTVHSAGVPEPSSGGGRATGTYYLLRNTVVIPSAALGGYLWKFVDPEVAFTAAAIGIVGTGYFLLFGEEFEAYL